MSSLPPHITLFMRLELLLSWHFLHPLPKSLALLSLFLVKTTQSPLPLHVYCVLIS